MGAVFRARRRLLGDEVAVKIVRAESAGYESARERFLRESRACAQLRHPNIVSILDFNLDAEGRPFLVMELLNGSSLRQEIAERAPFAIDDMQAIVLPDLRRAAARARQRDPASRPEAREHRRARLRRRHAAPQDRGLRPRPRAALRGHSADRRA
jgi:serine/threonine-protein kinase